ncbi:MAG: transposase, partial [Deltaproteobacteria bacterium]|nr:transposase [Deltaproteobacteria bacterium]
MRTYKFKLYYSKRNRRRLGSSVDLAGVIWNHCIALHRRYYCLFGKHLDVNALKKHITKLKRLGKHASWNELGSQAIQDIP